MTNAPDLTKDQYVLLLSMEAHVSSVSQHQIVRLIHQVMSAIQAPIPVYNVQVPLIVQLMVMDTLAAKEHVLLEIAAKTQIALLNYV